MIDKDLLNFYFILQISFSLFGAVLYFSVSDIITKQLGTFLNDITIKNDKGLVYIAYALICWVIAGVWYFGYNSFDKVNSFNGRYDNYYELIKSFISSLNNMFFLLSIVYFDTLPNVIRSMQTKLEKKAEIRWESFSYIITFFFCLLSLIIFLTQNKSGGVGYIVMIPDTLFSIISIIAIFLVLMVIFKERELYILAYVITPASIILTLYSTIIIVIPIVKDISYSQIHIASLIISKTSLISLIFFSLISWVIKRTSIPEPEKVFIKTKDDNTGNLSVTILIENYALFEEVNLTPMNSKALKLFIKRKKDGIEYVTVGADTDIQSKKKYELSSNYPRRLIKNIIKESEKGIGIKEKKEKSNKRDDINNEGKTDNKYRIIADIESVEMMLFERKTSAVRLKIPINNIDQ